MQKGLGHLVTAGFVFLWFIANFHCAHRGFVLGSAQHSAGLRGSPASSYDVAGEGHFQHYTKGTAGQTTMPVFNWTALVSMAAAFGLVAGVLSTPVHAEEVSSESTVVKKKKKTKAKSAEPAKEESSSGGLSLPSLPSLPSVGGGEAKPAGRPVNYSIDISNDLIDDNLDKDTKITDPNPPALFAILLGPSFIFIVFWILGSLDII